MVAWERKLQPKDCDLFIRRWLVADDVGLGKTIEAGMIIEVLHKRSRSEGSFRCLVTTPAGLMMQWKDEMEVRFGRRFRIFTSSQTNELEESNFLIASIDTLKNKAPHRNLWVAELD